MSTAASAFIVYACCLASAVNTEVIDYNKPISPEVYQKLIGHGFSVKYFTKLTDPFLKNYDPQNIQDIYDAGFRNLRLRSCAACYPYPYNTTNFTNTFLGGLEDVVDRCLEVGVTPIISWANSIALTYSNEEDEVNYIRWWSKVANRLRDKDYRLGFNLVTELADIHCKIIGCSESISENTEKYTRWMTKVVRAIRRTGGNNEKRILILGPPGYTANNLKKIDGPKIYGNDTYIMAEHHHYAAGPTNKTNKRYWEGCGNATHRRNLLEKLELAKNLTDLKTYWGAWMVQDNHEGGINQTEAECFAEFFVSTLKQWGIPWSLNALENYYNTATSTWITDIVPVQGTPLNFSRILKVIKDNM